MRGKSRTYDFLTEHVGYADDGCLIWPFSCDRHGYGHIGIGGKVHRTHRVMCEMAHGAAPSPDHHAAHSCGNRRCVNPKHLSWRTPSQNQFDRREQGTVNYAWWGNRGKLTEADKRRIVTLKGKHPQYVIAKMCGVSSHTVRRVHRALMKDERP